MKVAKDEILFIYDSNDRHQQEALSYIKSFKHYKVKELDVRKDDFTQLQLANIADQLNISEKELIKNDLESTIGDVMDLDTHDFLDYMVFNITRLKTPIALYHDHAKFVDSQYELIQEDNINNIKDVQTSKTIREKEGD